MWLDRRLGVELRIAGWNLTLLGASLEYGSHDQAYDNGHGYRSFCPGNSKIQTQNSGGEN
jgi:hypothetical protein